MNTQTKADTHINTHAFAHGTHRDTTYNSAAPRISTLEIGGVLLMQWIE